LKFARRDLQRFGRYPSRQRCQSAELQVLCPSQ